MLRRLAYVAAAFLVASTAPAAVAQPYPRSTHEHLVCGSAFQMVAQDALAAGPNANAEQMAAQAQAMLALAGRALADQGTTPDQIALTLEKYALAILALFEANQDPDVTFDECLALGEAALIAVASLAEQDLTLDVQPDRLTLPDPGSLTSYRDRVGMTFDFLVTGSSDSSVWGDGIYTDDSLVAVSAVHAGLLQPGETGIVAIEILPGQNSYEGIERNGISSLNYGEWGGSYRFIGVASYLDAGPMADPGNLYSVPGEIGMRLRFLVTGSTDGPVWGDGIYTRDSQLAAAAVHAGLVEPGEEAVVTVEILGPQDSYGARESHGVASQSYGPFDGSFRFVE